MSNSSVASTQKETATPAVVRVLSNEEKTKYRHITHKHADATLSFQEKYDAEVPEITPEQERRLARKIQWFIIPLVCLVDLLLYMDKATLSYATILGFMEDTKLTQDQYSDANTLFYAGFLIAQIPMNYLLQRLPIGKFLTAIVFSWTIIIFLHCAAHNHQGVYALRFFLGFTESIVVPLLNLTCGQFLTAKEKAASAPIFYSTCLGVTIPAGFIAYGLLYAESSVAAWRLFMIVIGALTSLLTLLVFFIYPDNPSTARFLTIEERIWTIRRVQATTGSAVEQKVFKKSQFVEALKDPISWLFAGFFLCQQLANNLTYQQNLLFTEMGGISSLDSTLVSVASGGFAVVCTIIATFLLSRIENITAISVVIWSLPSFTGSIVAATLPWSNNIGLLAALCLASPVFGIPWILMFSWNITSCSGYTKKITRNGIVMISYCVANMVSPQLWRSQDAPRYYPAWIVQIVLSFFVAPALAIVIRTILSKRNKERRANLESDAKLGVVEDSDGEVVVNVAALDLTDLENKAFIYPL